MLNKAYHAMCPASPALLRVGIARRDVFIGPKIVRTMKALPIAYRIIGKCNLLWNNIINDRAPLRPVLCTTLGYLCFGLMISLPAEAQRFLLGPNPPSLRWRQVQSAHTQVIFPAGQEVAALRVARMADWLADSASRTVGPLQGRVSILLQNQTTVPNGFVTVGPFRSEFFLTPPQYGFSGTANWVDMLTVHEYRHVQQYFNARQGVTRLASWLFGQNGWGFFAGMALPRWYWEGDAVLHETLLTPSGRGRIPEFTMQYAAVRQDPARHWNYEKASATSLRDFVPDHYALGYRMVAYARRHFGDSIWRDALRDAVRYKGLTHPLSRSLRRRTGLNTKQLYLAAMREIDSLALAEMPAKPTEDQAQALHPVPSVYTEYRNARWLPDGTLVADKSAYNQVRTLTQIVPGATMSEKKLTEFGLGLGSNNTLSVSGQWALWSEWTFDPRWGHVDYSVLRLCHLPTGRKHKITRRSRLFAPALSPDGSRIAAVEITPEQVCNLVLLDTAGRELRRFGHPRQAHLTFPRFVSAQEVVMVSQQATGHALCLLNLQTGTWEDLLPAQHAQLTWPAPAKGYILYGATYGGRQDIYALRLHDRQVLRVTQSRYGATQPDVSPDDSLLVFSSYSRTGYSLYTMPLRPQDWTPATHQPVRQSLGYPSPTDSELGLDATAVQGGDSLRIRRYSQLSGLVFPHSWHPVASPPNIGFEVSSDNKLSTLSASGSYLYNLNEGSGLWTAGLTYAQWYPVIDAGISQGVERRRARAAVFPLTDTTAFVGTYTRRWNEQTAFVRMTLPWNLSHDNYFAQVWLSAEAQRLRLRYLDERNAGIGRDLWASGLRLRFSRQKLRARQHILPRWWQTFDLRWWQTLGDDQGSSSQWQITSNLYFPGLRPNHSLFFNLGFREEDPRNPYQFRDQFFYTRGLGFAPFSQRAWRAGINYTFPLFYPDLALGGTAFLKRVKANVFADHSQTDFSVWALPTLENRTERPLSSRSAVQFLGSTYQSVGAEVTFDLRMFRLLDVDMGFRASYLTTPSNEPFLIEFVLFQVAP